jgi:hypothetical protein
VITVVVVVVVVVVVTMLPVEGSCLTLVSDGSDDCGLVDCWSDDVPSDPYVESRDIGSGRRLLLSPSFLSWPPPNMDRHLDFFSFSLPDGAIAFVPIEGQGNRSISKMPREVNIASSGDTDYFTIDCCSLLPKSTQLCLLHMRCSQKPDLL